MIRALLLSLLLCLPASAQGPSCQMMANGQWSCGQTSQMYGQRSQIGIINQSVIQSQPVQQVQTRSTGQYQRANEQKENNCLNFYAFDGDVCKGMCNGFVVGCIGQTTYVLTNTHAIKGGTSFRVKYVGGAVSEAHLLESDPILDVALLSSIDLRPRKGTIAHFAETDVRPGEFVQWISFVSPNEWSGGSLDNPRGLYFSRGQCVGLDGSWFRYKTQHLPQQGQSGSPLTNQQGRVIGIVVETVGSEGHSPPASKLKAFVDRVMLQKTADSQPLPLPDSRPILPEPNGPDEPVATPEPNCIAQCDGRFTAIEARVEKVEQNVNTIIQQWNSLGSNQCAELEQRVKALEDAPNPVLMPGPKGQKGDKGDRGEKGDPGDCPDIDEIMAAAVAKLPPLRIQTLNPDGTVHQDVEARLGDLIKLRPVTISGEN